ncbi:sensory box/GGDEF/GAF/EAL domain protein, partial [mine drainage metagenome]
NTLKIDQSFVLGLLHDSEDMELIKAVIALAQVFNRSVIAEGVESPEAGVVLMWLGCDLAQGFCISKALSGESVQEWVRHYRPDPSWALWSGVKFDLSDVPLFWRSTIIPFGSPGLSTGSKVLKQNSFRMRWMTMQSVVS